MFPVVQTGSCRSPFRYLSTTICDDAGLSSTAFEESFSTPRPERPLFSARTGQSAFLSRLFRTSIRLRYRPRRSSPVSSSWRYYYYYYFYSLIFSVSEFLLVNCSSLVSLPRASPQSPLGSFLLSLVPRRPRCRPVVLRVYPGIVRTNYRDDE